MCCHLGTATTRAPGTVRGAFRGAVSSGCHPGQANTTQMRSRGVQITAPGQSCLTSLETADRFKAAWTDGALQRRLAEVSLATESVVTAATEVRACAQPLPSVRPLLPLPRHFLSTCSQGGRHLQQQAGGKPPGEVVSRPPGQFGVAAVARQSEGRESGTES